MLRQAARQVRPLPCQRSVKLRRVSTQAVTGGDPLSLDAIVTFCKRRGFIYGGSGVYDSIGTGYDYGPLGSMLKRNVQDAWWRDFVERRADCVGIETAVLMNPRVWEASGHVQQFVDPLSECSSCRSRVRADKAVGEAVLRHSGLGIADATLPEYLRNGVDPGALSLPQLGAAILALDVACPVCGAMPSSGGGLREPRMFNLLFSTHVGPMSAADAGIEAATAKRNPNSTSSLAYLRPETAQGAFVCLPAVLNSTGRRLPLGIGQVGKSFRNEIAVGNFVFRTREFDQMELQYFCAPRDAAATFDYWVETAEAWLLRYGLRRESVRRRVYSAKELAHYALATTDLEFKYSFGWGELWGIANRGDHDLRAHAVGSGHNLSYRDPVSNEQYFPFAVEPAVGVNRLILALLTDGLREEVVPAAPGDDATTRLVLSVHEDLAPYKVAVLPLLKREPMMKMASDMHSALLKHTSATTDVTQSIGKRYRRQDESGTPLCITIDQQSTSDGTVTVRCRDTMQQFRLLADEVLSLAAVGAFKRSLLLPRFAAAMQQRPAQLSTELRTHSDM